MEHVVEPSYGFRVSEDYVTLLPDMVSRPPNYVLSSLYINRYDERSRLALAQILEKELEDREYPGLCTNEIPSEFAE